MDLEKGPENAQHNFEGSSQGEKVSDRVSQLGIKDSNRLGKFIESQEPSQIKSNSKHTIYFGQSANVSATYSYL